MAITKDDLASLIDIFSQFTKINKPLDIDEEYVEKTLETILMITPNLNLSSDDVIQLKRRIYTEFQIKQDDGTMLKDDYEHESWYINNKSIFGDFHWLRYKRYLMNKNFPLTVIDKLDSNLDEIVDSLGNPNTELEFLRRGLIIGDVQSGKTSNYIGLITKAADAGYKIIILLTGTIESLRKQTQIRVEEGFIGFDSIKQERVGVGLDNGPLTANAMTSRDNDFIKNIDKTTVLSVDGQKNQLIFVIKKNTTVLEKLYNAFKSINTSKLHPKIDQSLLLIDDEADNASINTNKPENDPTRTNRMIRRILELFTKSNYVGFTATPFANVFIDPTTDDEMYGMDLFPENFIFSLEAPSNYIGATKVFSKSSNHVRVIDDQDDYIFSHKHKKDWDGKSFFDSLYNSIYAFLIANAIRDQKGDLNKHRSMLINVSRFVKVQFKIKDLVKLFMEKTLHDIKYQIHRPDEIALQNETVSNINDVWEEEYENIIEWKYLKKHLYDAIKDIKVLVVNSSSQSEKLDYEANEKNGLRVIAIGGLALSRGLTLEGLMTSYFYRNTSTFDVLMQMGRWFGYRDGYEDICRLWITEESAEWYKEISEATELLKKDIKIMHQQGKKPREFGIRVRNDSEVLGITSPNKMRSTITKEQRITYFGDVFEAPYLINDMSLSIHHYEIVKNFSSKLHGLDTLVSHPYFRDIDNSLVRGFIERLIPHPASTRFDIKQITSFLDGKYGSMFKSWDVLFMEGRKDETHPYLLNEELHVYPIERSFDLIDNEIIRVSGSRARLGAKEDTKNGLTKKQIIEAEVWSRDHNHGVSAKTYLVENRNPLLIIYLINLKNEKQHAKEQEIIDQLRKENIPLVGFSVAFPRNESELFNDVEYYVVNKHANYFELNMTSEGDENDGDE